MPIEIRRFGVGHRRPDGPPGTTGVTGQSIHVDGRGAISELAFARAARIEPHANPNTSWLIVIEGGGWVGVGDERTRIAAGEAVLWPADVPHAAWTEHSEMRAFVVEFAGFDDSAVLGYLEANVTEVAPGADRAPDGLTGGLVDDGGRTRPDPDAGEPA
ncbi:MAG: cupin domain-containing protein [Candidatus Limnocylindrales bacterium]